MFSEHGSFHVELRGNILFLDIEGAWNIETALAYQKEIAEAIKPIIGQNWAVVTLMDDWELCTPDSEKVIVKIVLDAIGKGLIREAVVSSQGTLKLELFDKYSHVNTSSDTTIEFKRHIYQDEKKALEWLSSEGFSVDHVEK